MKDNKSIYFSEIVIILSFLLPALAPLPRVVCFDGCQWSTGSILLPHSLEFLASNLFAFTIGLLFLIPPLVFAGHVIVFFLCIVGVNVFLQKTKQTDNRKLKIILLVIASLVATGMINFVYARFNPSVSEEYLTAINEFMKEVES